MIVKNEAHVIARCLKAARGFIDHWVIVDTGSTDETEKEVKKALEGIPGEFHKREWKGYGLSRTAAFDLAIGKADYALVLDADEVLCSVPSKIEAFMNRTPAYGIWLQTNNVRYPQLRLFQLKRRWRYVGVLHEFPTCDGGWKDEMLDDLKLISPRDGARSNDPAKYRRDAETLAAAIKTEKDALLRTRYVFYLAQSWRDAGARSGGPEDEQAIKFYLERAEMGPGLQWQEAYISLLEAGRAMARLGQGDKALETFLRAYHSWPARIEATRELASMFAHRVATSPRQGSLFTEV
jgi:glycosyltransferase involved in cell wall biosynthesis